MSAGLQSRVDREKAAHTENDVLGENRKVKAIFSHAVSSNTMRRMHADYRSHLTDVAGLSILDIGCGHGELSLQLLERGAAFIAGIDISDNYVDVASSSAKTQGFSPDRFEFRVMDAHHLEYADNFFDIVAGNGILHHLDLPTCLAEMERVLKPGGFALFIEPLAGNPMLRLFRRLTPRARTLDEKPLDTSDLRSFEEHWQVKSRYYGILSAPVAAFTSIFLRLFPNNPLLTAADWMERRLSKHRTFDAYNQYVMLVLIKKQKTT